MREQILAVLVALAAAGGAAACDANDGPMEEAGEEIDDAVDEVN